MASLDTAIDTVSERLQTLGAMGSRLSFKEEDLTEAQVNTEAAYNRIANADMAMSQLEATKYQILAADGHLDAGPGQPGPASADVALPVNEQKVS